MTAAPITVTATGGTSVYGSSPSNPGFTVTGLVNSQTTSVLTGLSNSFGITSASDVGSSPYTLAVSGILSNANYSITARNTADWSVTPATLTYLATSAVVTSGNTFPTFTGIVNGFVNTDSIATSTTGTLAFTSLATPASAAGYYAINGSGLTANNGNYVFTQASGNSTALRINSATPTEEHTITNPTVLASVNAAQVPRTVQTSSYTAGPSQVSRDNNVMGNVGARQSNNDNGNGNNRSQSDGGSNNNNNNQTASDNNSGNNTNNANQSGNDNNPGNSQQSSDGSQGSQPNGGTGTNNRRSRRAN